MIDNFFFLNYFIITQLISKLFTSWYNLVLITTGKFIKLYCFLLSNMSVLLELFWFIIGTKWKQWDQTFSFTVSQKLSYDSVCYWLENIKGKKKLFTN